MKISDTPVKIISAKRFDKDVADRGRIMPEPQLQSWVSVEFEIEGKEAFITLPLKGWNQWDEEQRK